MRALGSDLFMLSMLDVAAAVSLPIARCCAVGASVGVVDTALFSRSGFLWLLVQCTGGRPAAHRRPATP